MKSGNIENDVTDVFAFSRVRVASHFLVDNPLPLLLSFFYKCFKLLGGGLAAKIEAFHVYAAKS